MYLFQGEFRQRLGSTVNMSIQFVILFVCLFVCLLIHTQHWLFSLVVSCNSVTFWQFQSFDCLFYLFYVRWCFWRVTLSELEMVREKILKKNTSSKTTTAVVAYTNNDQDLRSFFTMLQKILFSAKKKKMNNKKTTHELWKGGRLLVQCITRSGAFVIQLIAFAVVMTFPLISSQTESRMDCIHAQN